MILAGHQPYFFPYIGQFTLIKHSDKFIILDTTQFTRRGWINRNRILDYNGKPTHITVSTIKAPVETRIDDIKINDKLDWRNRILKQLKVYKEIAPYYNEVIAFIERCLEYDTDNLSELNIYTLRETCNYLNIKSNIKVFSEMDLKIDKVNAPDEWGLNMAKAVGAKECFNAPGGIEFYDRDKYIANGIDLTFIKPNLKPYDQKQDEFVPALSIIDVMMFNSIKEIHQMLDDYQML